MRSWCHVYLQRERDTLADEKKTLEHELMLAKQETLQKEQRAKDFEVKNKTSTSTIQFHITVWFHLLLINT